MNKRILALLAVMLFVAPMLGSCGEPAVDAEPSNDAKRKHALLIEQIQYWTKSEAVDLSIIGRTDHATVHLTYLAPQLIDAAIDYQVALKGKWEYERTSALSEARRRLQKDKHIPFILTVQPNTMPGYLVDVGVPESLFLYTVSGRLIRPSEYDRIFEDPFGGMKSRSGYVFFPYVDTASQRVNYDEEPSLTVKMNSLRFVPSRADLQEWRAQLVWNFNLVPADIPLQAIEKLDAGPARLLSASDLDALVDAVLAVVSMSM